MDSSTRKTVDDLRRQANIMISSGYSLTTTAHVLGVNSETLKKWIDPREEIQNRTLARKM